MSKSYKISFLVPLLLSLLAIGFYILFRKKTINNQGLKSTAPGKVIILNGPSASGKSSTIKAFQDNQKDLWLAAGIDNFFVGLIPPKFYLEDKPENYSVMRGVASQDTQGNKLFTLTIGERGQKIIKGMHRAIAEYAKQGNNVIIDYILYDKSWLKDLRSVLKGIKVYFVGIKMPLDILEEREKARGTSPVGHARSHYESVHDGMIYDLELDTSQMNPEQCSEKISSFITK